MKRYDIVDEAVLAVRPSEVLEALTDEAAGRSTWWSPFARLHQRGERPADQVGAVVEVAVDGTGHVERRRGGARFTGRVTQVVPDRRLSLEYFEGDFLGTIDWVLEPVDEGHTRVTVRWRTRPHGMMRLLSHVVDVPSGHSKVIQEGLHRMERYVISRRPVSPAPRRERGTPEARPTP